MNADVFIYVVELLGTAAFASSGALVAMATGLVVLIRMLAVRCNWNLPRALPRRR